MARLILPPQSLADGIAALRLVDERDLPLIEQASRDPEIATRFGLSTRTASEYLKAFKQGWSEGIAAAFAVTERGGSALGQVLLEVRESGRADVGYWLLAEARGRGPQREDGSRVDAVFFSLLPEECGRGRAQ